MIQGAKSSDPRKAADQVKLRGTTICPGIGIGRVRILDRGFTVPTKNIPAAQVQSEQQRYSRAIRKVSDHLREHIQADHWREQRSSDGLRRAGVLISSLARRM